jgi:hypothetical protein
MPNNLASYTNLINAAAMTAVANKLAFLDDFTTSFSDEEISQRRSSIKVPLLSGSSVVTNPTTFGGGSNGSTMITVDTNHIHVPFYLSNAEIQNGYKLEALVVSNMQVLADHIQSLAFAPIASATGFATATTVAQSAFALANLQEAWKAVPGGPKVAYLGGTAFSKLLTNSTTQIDPMLGVPYAGFQKVAYTDAITGYGTNVYGFVSSQRKGLVMASGIPAMGDLVRELIDSELITLDNGLTVQLNRWGSTTDRSDNASLDVYFGAAAGDKTALAVIKSA